MISRRGGIWNRGYRAAPEIQKKIMSSRQCEPFEKVGSTQKIFKIRKGGKEIGHSESSGVSKCSGKTWRLRKIEHLSTNSGSWKIWKIKKSGKRGDIWEFGEMSITAILFDKSTYTPTALSTIGSSCHSNIRLRFDTLGPTSILTLWAPAVFWYFGPLQYFDTLGCGAQQYFEQMGRDEADFL